MIVNQWSLNYSIPDLLYDLLNNCMVHDYFQQKMRLSYYYKRKIIHLFVDFVILGKISLLKVE